MQQISFGSTNLTVTRLCLGTMQFGWTANEAESFAILDAYVAAGGNFLDSADVYSNWAKGNRGGEAETILGRWLSARGNRGDMVIATKCRGKMWGGPDGEGLTGPHIARACEESLRRLGIETIDLYQFHWFDDNVPLEESLGAVGELIAAGKVRYFGVSNYPPERFRALVEAGQRVGVPVSSLQPHHNMVHRAEFEGELQQICLDNGIAVIPYSPLAKGFLTGKYVKGGPRIDSSRAGGVKEYQTNRGWSVIDAVREVAASHGTTPSAVALAWQLAQPGITASIVGANSPAQLADQLPAVDLNLNEQDLDRLDSVSAPGA